MAEKPTTTEFNSNFPVAGWSRNTVADGKWLNNNTIEPLKKRDTELLTLINDNSTESEEADMNLAEGLNNLKEEIETTFELSAGNNITLVEDSTGKILTINAADTPVDNFVTSAKDIISQDGLAYFLIKDGESSKWDGIDLSAKFAEKVDKDEFNDVVDQIEDAFVDLSATVDRDYVKKGEIPDPVFYDISASYANAYSGTYGDKDYYFVEGAKIKGKDGLSAEYDETKNEWEIGLETTDLSYLYDNYTNNGIAVTSGDVIKFNTSHSQDIDIDSDGNIEIPETVNKFTININEFIEGNIPDVHNFLLNKLSLYSGDSKIISTQNYYNAEVGSSNATIALTIDNTSYSTHAYTLKYEGSDIAAAAQLNITISILEEVTCLSEVNEVGVTITSSDNSIQVSESIDADTNTKTFDLSVANDATVEYGRFIASDVTSVATLIKTRGNIELSDNKIQLNGSTLYHFTVRGSYRVNTLSNTLQQLSFIEYSTFNPILVNVDNSISDTQFFEFSFDVYASHDIAYPVSFSMSNDAVVNTLEIDVHSVVAGSGSSSSTDSTAEMCESMSYLSCSVFNQFAWTVNGSYYTGVYNAIQTNADLKLIEGTSTVTAYKEFNTFDHFQAVIYKWNPTNSVYDLIAYTDRYDAPNLSNGFVHIPITHVISDTIEAGQMYYVGLLVKSSTLVPMLGSTLPSMTWANPVPQFTKSGSVYDDEANAIPAATLTTQYAETDKTESVFVQIHSNGVQYHV